MYSIYFILTAHYYYELFTYLVVYLVGTMPIFLEGKKAKQNKTFIVL